MPIQFRYDPQRDLLLHRGEGRIAVEDIDELRVRRREAGIPAVVQRTLTDLRLAKLDVAIAELKEHESGRTAEEYAGTRHAEVVSDPQQTAILMMWRNWLPKELTVEVFSTLEAAYDWLGVEAHEDDFDF